MEKIIEKMVKQEIKNILAENDASIEEMVRTSLLPQLRVTVREEITNTLSELLERDSKALKRPVPIKENPHTESTLPLSPTIPQSAIPARLA